MSTALLFSAPVFSLAPVVDKRTDMSVDSRPSQQHAVQGFQPGEGSIELYRELFDKVQMLQQEVMQLRGLVEEQAYALDQLQQQSMERYIDLDRRIATLGSVPLAEVVPSQ